MPPAPPAIFMRTTLALSGLTLLSALGGLAGGIASQAYFLSGFEVVVIVACVLGVLTGLGKFNSGPSIAIACTAGCVFVAGFLTFLYIRSVTNPIFGVPPRYFLAFRMLMALGMFACAGGVLLSRKPNVSIPLLIKGAVLGAPVVAALGAWVAVPGARSTVLGMNTTLLALVATPGALIGIALLSASVHCVIRAFEVGIEAGSAPESAQGV